MSTEDWRSPAAYQYAATMEPASLAWEFLRRNPDYRNAYKAAPAQADDGTEGLGRRWGLRFPCRSKSPR